MTTTNSMTTAARGGVTATTATTDVAVPGGVTLAAYAAMLGDPVTGTGPRPGGEPGTLALAFPVDGSTHHVGVAVRQRAPEVVSVEIGAEGPVPDEVLLTAIEQVRRVLSLDLDGPGFAEVAHADPVLGALWARCRRVRPVLFHSPYEAACWAVVCQRLRVAQTAAIMRDIARRWGRPVRVGALVLPSFPAPHVLRDLDVVPGLSGRKVRRLREIAQAALDGALTAEALREKPAEEGIAAVRSLPGIGPFSAELVLARGAGHPDVFPLEEPGLHATLASVYGVRGGAEIARLAERWTPYRSWAAFLLREAGRLAASGRSPFTGPDPGASSTAAEVLEGGGCS